MFGAEQASLGVSEEHGYVNLQTLIEGSERLKIVRDVAKQQRFFHWELEFSDVFAARGGFDLILGNPPWIKVEWNEGAVMGGEQPLLGLRDFSAPQLAVMRVQAMSERPKLQDLYLREYAEFEGTQAFLNAKQNYCYLVGSQSNTFKCFETRSWEIASGGGVQAFLHPEGVYDDPKGGVLRSTLYPRLRYHFQSQNELNLFDQVHHETTFSINVYAREAAMKLSISQTCIRQSLWMIAFRILATDRLQL